MKVPSQTKTASPSNFQPLQAASLAPLPLPSVRTLPLPLPLLVPQKTRPVPHHRRLKVQRAGQHVAVPAAPAETPLGIKRRRGRQQAVGDKPRRQRRDGRFDVVAAGAAVCLRVLRRARQGQVGAGEGVGRALRAGAEDGARAG